MADTAEETMTLPRNDMDKIDTLMIYRMLEDLSKRLGVQVQSISESVAIMQKHSIHTSEMIERLIKSLAESRDQRYEQEIETLHGQLEIVHRQFALLEDELEKKRAAKADTLTTSQKMAAVAASQIAESEEDRLLKRQAFWQEVWRNNVVKPTITALTIGVLGFLGYLFFQFILPALAAYGAR